MSRRVVTRREVLELSGHLFATHGYRSTSLELVADGLGVTRQALYYHFKNKGEILGALFEQMMTKLETGVASAADGYGPEPRLIRMLRAHVEVTVANPDLVALLLNERPEIARIERLHAAKRRRDYARLFLDAFEEGVRDGALHPTDSWIAVNTLISAINGVSWWYHGESAGTAATATTQIATSLLDLLAHGFVARVPAAAPAALPSP
jgi:AcrR family transcriptional regulator